jgi:LysM repeat protein
LASIVAVATIGSFGLAACGTPTGLPASDSEVIPTDFKTFPPPTTTIPPTTTTPPEPGSVLLSEATYVVEDGDYPFVVADRFGVDFDEMVALNGWTIVDGAVPEWPEPGATIRIPAGATVPDGPAVLVPIGTVAPDPSTDTTPGSTPGTDDSATGTSAAVDNGVGCGTYTVVEGDYLGRVATKLNTTVEKLDTANDDTDGYGAFYIGLVINVPC